MAGLAKKISFENRDAVIGGNGSDTVVSDAAGINCTQDPSTSVCSEQVPIDYTVTLTAHPAGTDVFDGWSGGGCSGTSASCTVSMSAAATVTATFSSTHLLSLGVGIPSAGGVITLSADVTVQPGNFNQHLTTGDYSYSLPFTDGTVVTITVTPNSLVPVLWGGACAGTSGDTCTITMNSDQTATASLNVS